MFFITLENIKKTVINAVLIAHDCLSSMMYKLLDTKLYFKNYLLYYKIAFSLTRDLKQL